jgi:hypothetical protein
MMLRATFTRDGKEYLLHTAWAEYASGPGWSNTIYWAVVSQGDGPLEKIAIQPDEQSNELKTLFQISEATHQSVVRCAVRCLGGKG